VKTSCSIASRLAPGQSSAGERRLVGRKQSIQRINHRFHARTGDVGFASSDRHRTVVARHRHLDGNDGIGAARDRVDVIGLEFGVGHRAQRLADGGDGGVDGPGTGAAGDALLTVDVESDTGGRDRSAAGGGEIEQVDDALAVLAGDVLGDGQQVGVRHSTTAITEFCHAGRDFGDLVVVGLDAVFLERRCDTCATGMLAECESALPADGLGA